VKAIVTGRRSRRFVGLFAVLALATAACSGSQGDSGSATTAAATPTTSPEVTAARTTTVEPAVTEATTTSAPEGAPPRVIDSSHDAGVASANSHATDAGIAILEEGGSAIDAAIAVQAVLGLVEPQSSGLGGGAFMLYYAAETQVTTAYDGREEAPSAATPALFLDENGDPLGFVEATGSGRAVGGPGVIAMLQRAHAEHGDLEWGASFRPAIEIARAGFEVSPRMADALALMLELGASDEAGTTLFQRRKRAPRRRGSLHERRLCRNA
jgi:gamma-glutamyltranspeptidase/glutathione hydrolase